MVWKGVIIEQSLEDKDLMKLVRVVETRKMVLEEESERGVMTLFLVEVDDSKKDEFVEKAKDAIKDAWYIHICKDGTMIVIFKDKAFEFTENEQDKIDEARDYGLSIGIKREQLSFENLINDAYHTKRDFF